MTAYFDSTHSKIRDIVSRADVDLWEKAKAFDIVEEALVFDCTIAAEWPGFPEDLRDVIHKIVVKLGLASLPINMLRPCMETVEDHGERLHKLCWDLHTAFHEVAYRQLEGFSDDPRFPVRALYAVGEERRENLAASAPQDPEPSTS